MEAGQVALFIDVENIRYSLMNDYGVEPDFQALMEKARKYGKVAEARAYADFSEHPESVRRQMDIAGVRVQDIPLRRSRSASGVERVKSSADMHMVLDIVETVLDRPSVGTFVIVAGDSDYLRITTWLRNRFEKRVIICGVPGSVASTLASAASEVDPVEVPLPDESLFEAAVEALVRMIKKGPSPLEYWTVKIISQWADSAHQHIPGGPVDHKRAVDHLLQTGILVTDETERRGRQVREAHLNEEHPEVQRILQQVQINPVGPS